MFEIRWVSMHARKPVLAGSSSLRTPNFWMDGIYDHAYGTESTRCLQNSRLHDRFSFGIEVLWADLVSRTCLTSNDVDWTLLWTKGKKQKRTSTPWLELWTAWFSNLTHWHTLDCADFFLDTLQLLSETRVKNLRVVATDVGAMNFKRNFPIVKPR